MGTLDQRKGSKDVKRVEECFLLKDLVNGILLRRFYLGVVAMEMRSICGHLLVYSLRCLMGSHCFQVEDIIFNKGIIQRTERDRVNSFNWTCFGFC